jgi:hypothetical protein
VHFRTRACTLPPAAATCLSEVLAVHEVETYVLVR